MFKPRVWMIYLVMAVALFFLLNRDQLGEDVLNACRPSVDYVHLFSYGKVPVNAQELRRGVAFYQTLLLTNPKLPFVYVNKGFCHFYLGEVDEAIAAYRRSLPMASYVYTAYFDLGYIFLSRGQYAEAAPYFEKSRSLIPRDKNDFMEILKIAPEHRLDPRLNEDPALTKRVTYDLRMIYVYLGQIYTHLKDDAKLAALSTEGMTLFPDDPEMYLYAGQVKLNAGDLKSAVLLFSNSLVVEPRYADGYLYRSRIWQMVGDVPHYQADMAKYEEVKKMGEWKRAHDIQDLHHWHDTVLFFQIH